MGLVFLRHAYSYLNKKGCAVRKGLDEESLAIFDLLRKPDINAADIKRIKAVAINLLEQVKQNIAEIDHWRDRESSRDKLLQSILDYLWDDKTGLPVDAFDEEQTGL